jgi:hypothetical protein
MKVKLLNVLSSFTKPEIKPKLFQQACHTHSTCVPKWGTIDLHPQLGNWVMSSKFSTLLTLHYESWSIKKNEDYTSSYWEFNNGGKNSNFFLFPMQKVALINATWTKNVTSNFFV